MPNHIGNDLWYNSARSGETGTGREYYVADSIALEALSWGHVTV